MLNVNNWLGLKYSGWLLKLWVLESLYSLCISIDRLTLALPSFLTCRSSCPGPHFFISTTMSCSDHAHLINSPFFSCQLHICFLNASCTGASTPNGLDGTFSYSVCVCYSPFYHHVTHKVKTIPALLSWLINISIKALITSIWAAHFYWKLAECAGWESNLANMS